MEEREETRKQSHPCGSKWVGKRRLRGFDRPGRGNDAERRYCRGKEHFGKGKTMRTHRTGKDGGK